MDQTEQQAFESEKAASADLIIDEVERSEIKRQQEAQCVEWITAELERLKDQWGDPEQFDLALSYVALALAQHIDKEDVEPIAEVASAFNTQTTVQ